MFLSPLHNNVDIKKTFRHSNPQGFPLRYYKLGFYVIKQGPIPPLRAYLSANNTFKTSLTNSLSI